MVRPCDADRMMASATSTIATPSRWTGSQDFAQADLVQPSLDQRLLGLERIEALHAARATRAA